MNENVAMLLFGFAQKRVHSKKYTLNKQSYSFPSKQYVQSSHGFKPIEAIKSSKR